MFTRRQLVWGVPLALALTWATTAWFMREDGAGPQAAVPVYTDWHFNPYAKGAPLAAVQHNADADRAADAARARVQAVLERGSLQGSELDGDWGRWVNGQLQPSHSLRQRFDYLLTSLGEASPTELRHWIEQEVAQQMSAGAARQVLAVWDRYIALQQHAFRHRPHPADPLTWQTALSERAQVRQQVLGRDWAQAFYAEDEAAFARYIGERTGTSASAATPPDATTPLGADAAERLRAEDSAWADWERRLAAAHQALNALATAPHLSAPQRQQAQDDHLAQHFAGSELLRARALLLTDR
jgi:lipase chaperone LimK